MMENSQPDGKPPNSDSNLSLKYIGIHTSSCLDIIIGLTSNYKILPNHLGIPQIGDDFWPVEKLVAGDWLACDTESEI